MTQAEALDILKLGLNVFLTGPAGSGKTHLLNSYIAYLEERGVPVAVTASTGVAATHLGGMTIHSWSGIGIRDAIDESELARLAKKSNLKDRFAETKVLVIDEISMLHAHQLDMVDQILRAFRELSEPFGGLQVIVCGDFFQLPPVSRYGDAAQFAYDSTVWRSGVFTPCYLSEQFRQEEDELLTILNDIRSGTTGEHTRVPLRARYNKDPEGNKLPTKLYARNINVDSINDKSLDVLVGDEKIFKMETKGFSQLVEGLKKSCLAPEILRLKLGAEVMFVKNNPTGAYVNGTRGVIESFDKEDGLPWVKTYEGRRIHVQPEEWRLEEDGKVRAMLTQLPLRLAWAITVHKSQGMTLDAAEIDLSDAFEPGMGYVALSRVRSLKGLKLMGLNDTALRVHPDVKRHDEHFQRESTRAREMLDSIVENERETLQKRVLVDRFGGTVEVQFGGGRKKKKQKIRRESTVETTRKMIEKKMSIKAIAEERGMTTQTIVGHLEKMKEIGNMPDIEYLKPDKRRYEVIAAALSKSKDMKLTPAKIKLGDNYTFEEIQLVRLFL